MKTPRPLALALLAIAFTFSLTGCGGSKETASGVPRVSVQTDWYPQAEHGGFYQAVEDGSYAAAGIAVDILPGGPSAAPAQKIATGRVDFAIGRSDDVMLAVQEGLPLVIVCALMQHDPQALLLHEENPINSLEELDGKTVMSVPGSAWIRNVEATFNIQLSVIPLNYGLAQFMADKSFIQQCFVTNEPFFVKENGANPKTILLAQPGYDPYRVIYTSRSYIEKHPDRVKAFVAASIKGWENFLFADATAAKAKIGSLNENMTENFMEFSRQAMIEYHLVEGYADRGERVGVLQADRLNRLADRLLELGLLREPMPLEKYVTFDFLPGELKALVNPTTVAQP